jgi:BirA family biotin operon repressor/biotin-[acetyl-CoA-carboxylase] ligase
VIVDERVRTATRFRDVRLLGEVDSTNRVVADLAAAGAPEGLVVAADFQAAGRGRLDRSWEALPGDGLLVSVLLRPAGLAVERWHLVTAAAALAARDACAAVAGVRPELKWPNDLLVGPAKLAGILAEAAGGALVVGMGLNVHGGPPGAAVLDEVAGRRVSRSRLLEAWLVGLDALLGDWPGVEEAYRASLATAGREVRVDLAGGEVLEGLAESVDGLGRLLVRPPGSAPVAVAAGDVTHLRHGPRAP